MKIQKVINGYDFILTEAAVIEALRRSGKVTLDPHLDNAILIYDDVGKSILSNLYRSFISIAHGVDIPFVFCTPTWRANRQRVSKSNVTSDVNADAVKFLFDLRNEWGSWKDKIMVGGLIGCKNDCYKPEEGISKEDAKRFHGWQIDKLAKVRPDFLLAATLPALPEATGIALAMEKTGVPYILSFVINRKGCILDGTSLEHAFGEIDAACSSPPLCYMINCSYPSFLKAGKQPETTISRLIGFQANASSLDHSYLDESGKRHGEEISDWGKQMISLNRRYGLKILGGCCGTRLEHLQYLVDNIYFDPCAVNNNGAVSPNPLR